MSGPQYYREQAERAPDLAQEVIRLGNMLRVAAGELEQAEQKRDGYMAALDFIAQQATSDEEHAMTPETELELRDAIIRTARKATGGSK